MKLFNRSVFPLLALISSVCNAIEAPTHPTGEVSYHDFLDTPFLDDEKFENTVISGSTGITYHEINEQNDQIRSSLESLVSDPFFRIFKLNLYKSCPFWEQEGFCLYRSCAVDTINDWADLPEIWRPEELGKIQNSQQISGQQKQSLDKPLIGDECIDEIENNNYCHIDGADEDCVYVDLVENPERFTGYGGEQSFQIWKLIYDENCFFQGDGNVFNNGDEPTCIEKQIFYRLISGMHSSISTHLTNDYLNLKTKEYEPNLLQFMFKVGNFPDRIENMYLNYILVVKSLIKLYQSHYLDQLSLCPTQFSEKENELRHGLKDLVKPFLSMSNDDGDAILFNENDLFQNPDAIDMKNEFKMRFRNVSSIMDCVHCDRCRVWGKVQTIGYGTALKVLFELDTNNYKDFSLEKIELIALINTFDRLSKSVQSVKNFEKMFIGLYNKETMSDSTSETLDTQTKVRKQLKDFSFPEVNEKPKTKERQTVKEAFMTELGEVQDALAFIWESYFSLPKIVYDYAIIRVSKYWNKFIGVGEPIELDEDSYLQTLFDRSLQTEA